MPDNKLPKLLRFYPKCRPTVRLPDHQALYSTTQLYRPGSHKHVVYHYSTLSMMYRAPVQPSLQCGHLRQEMVWIRKRYNPIDRIMNKWVYAIRIIICKILLPYFCTNHGHLKILLIIGTTSKTHPIHNLGCCVVTLSTFLLYQLLV